MFWSKKDQHEFKPLLVEIEEEPLNPLGRWIFWAIICALVFFSLWMFFGQVDVVVTARGKVIPAGEVKVVQPLTSGVVSSILVKPGQLVEAGQVLMEIDPTDTEPELASMKADQKQVKLEILRINALLSGTDFTPPSGLYERGQVEVQRRLYVSAKGKLARQVQAKRDELLQVQERLAGAQKSYEQNMYLYDASQKRLKRLEPVRDLISEDVYDQALRDVATYSNKLASIHHQLEELKASKKQILEQIHFIEEDNRNQLLTDLAKKQQELLYLNARIERTEFVNARQKIRAPVRGYVSQLLVHTIGGVVNQAEKLAVLVPSDSKPVIKAHVLNKDVGYVHPGMDVAIKVDTFEFQKYGMLKGQLLQVSQDSVEDERLGLVYEAYVEPLETTLVVDGAVTQLSTGMSVTAEIKVGKRRIIELFVYPLVKYMNEGTSIR